MSNINGKVYAMNVITPMRPWKTPILRLIFFILGHVKSLQQDLINLSFIEFARWVIIPRHSFPRPGEKNPPEDLQYDYLLFFSKFIGRWRDGTPLEYGNDAHLGNDKDPAIGNHDGSGKFFIQGDTTPTNPPFVCAGLPQFVELRGGDYFFLPSITALGMLAMGLVDPR